MNVIYLILCVAILQVQASKKIKICKPKKQKLFDVKQAENSFLRNTKDEININGNFSLPLDVKDVISGNMFFSNIKISGFHNYTFTLLPIAFTLNGLKIQGDNYNIQGDVADLFDIYGNGSFEINLEGIQAKISLSPSWPLLRCINVMLNVKLQNMKVEFKQIMGGDKLLEPVINKVIGDMGPDIVDYYYPIIYDTLQPIIQKILDETINKDGLEDFSMLHLGNETAQHSEYIRTSLKILSNILFTS